MAEHTLSERIRARRDQLADAWPHAMSDRRRVLEDDVALLAEAADALDAAEQGKVLPAFRRGYQVAQDEFSERLRAAEAALAEARQDERHWREEACYAEHYRKEAEDAAEAAAAALAEAEARHQALREAIEEERRWATGTAKHLTARDVLYELARSPDGDETDRARALAEQTLDDGYPFPAEHRWWKEQAERHAHDVLALVARVDAAEDELARSAKNADTRGGWQR